MKKSILFSGEFIYQLFALLVVVIFVHALYVGIIRPNADAFLSAQAALLETDKSQITQRSFFVIIRDFEQEVCFILMLWALSIICYKMVAISKEGVLLQKELIHLPEDLRVLPEDAFDIARKIQSLPPGQLRSLLPQALLAALQRFSTTRNIQDAANATRAYCSNEAERLDSELSMIRYIAWAIPSVGFIGTVRGIGDALGQAYKAVEGDIFGVTQSLGVAFNSTFVALLISILLMFMVYQLQRMQERYILDAEAYCEEKLTRHLSVP
jgi:biopolymer transport protein ExbB/TolQ